MIYIICHEGKCSLFFGTAWLQGWRFQIYEGGTEGGEGDKSHDYCYFSSMHCYTHSDLKSVTRKVQNQTLSPMIKFASLSDFQSVVCCCFTNPHPFSTPIHFTQLGENIRFLCLYSPFENGFISVLKSIVILFENTFAK